MKMVATIQIVASLLCVATAVDTVRDVRRLHGKKKGGGREPIKGKKGDGRGSIQGKKGGGRGPIKGKGKKVVIDYSIDLTPENEIDPFANDPFVGIDGTSGFAKVTITHGRSGGKGKGGRIFDVFDRSDDEFAACVDAQIYRFAPIVPKAAHIHFAPINENGDVVVDFTPLLDGKRRFDGCVGISEELQTNILKNPHLYYVNVHNGTAPSPDFNTAIRGQLLSGFRAALSPRQTVAPFNDVKGIRRSRGKAKITFEAAGSKACFNDHIYGFDPLLGHIHKSSVGTNGPLKFNYSSLKSGTGKFSGCLPTNGTTLEATITDVLDLLANPQMYYFDYHLSNSTEGNRPGINVSIRGQIKRY